MALSKLPAEIKIGAAEVLFDDVTVGHTEEGQSVSVTKDIVTRTVDQFGTSKIEEVVVGMHIDITVQIAQWVYDALLVALPETTKGTGDYVMAGSVPGQKLGDTAAELILRPYAATGATEDVTIHKATAREVGEISVNNEGDRMVPVTFEGLIDITKGDGDRLYRMAAPASGA